MGILDSILGRMGGGGGAAGGAAPGGGAGQLSSILGMLMSQGGGGGGAAAGGGADAGGGMLGSLLKQLAGGGLGDQVKSWVGSGENQGITADQARSALGDDAVRRAAAHWGVSEEEAARGLSELLPQAVDEMTPQGRLDDRDKPADWNAEDDDWF